MYRKWRGRIVRNVVAAVALAVVPLSSIQAHGEEPAADVCRAVPEEDVAAAVKGRVLDSASYDGKCVYIVGFDDEALPRRTFVVYQHAADEYEGLRRTLTGEVENIDGLGDEAVMTYDEESMRYWLLVGKQGRVAFQVSGDDPDMLLRLAEVTLAKLASEQ